MNRCLDTRPTSIPATRGNRASTRHAARRRPRTERGIGRSDDGRGRELRDRDVIRMSVRAVRSERHDDVRTNSPQVRGDACDHLARRSALSRLLIAIFEQRRHRGCRAPSCRRAQLVFTNLGERRRAGMLSVAGPMAAEAAASPRVAVTRDTSTPSAAYFASVPPKPSDSSSGWASTAIRRRAVRVTGRSPFRGTRHARRDRPTGSSSSIAAGR